ncbi:MAG: HAMP domain-containing histidine kinase [Proteobacteria bacterium]|nr:HAMP domain-containing histidine kinase [Pseudomonadota bacterium]
MKQDGHKQLITDTRDKLADPKDTRQLKALIRRIQELTEDIGKVLHANTSILFMTQQTLDVAISALGPNSFGDLTCPTTEEVDRILAEPSKQVVRALGKFLDVLDQEDRRELLTETDRESLRTYQTILSDVKQHVPIPEFRASTLRTVASRIQGIVDSVPAGRRPRELVRNLLRAAREIERCAALATLLQTRSAILQMDYTIRSFREFVTTDVRRSEKTTRLRVAAVIEEAHRQLAEYAYTSKVEIRTRDQARDAEVLGVEREIVRAFANLLHNAIKYSWHRDNTQPPWVSVRTYRSEQTICVEFENWGVPISSRELRDHLVFELGYRGKWSKDRGRLGTGIGLTDARDIAERHRGELTITSRPARSWGPDDSVDDEYYQQPFLTTVTVSLPEAV